MFAFDNFEIGALYLIQDFMRTPKLTDFLESMTDLGNAGFIWLALAIVLICTKKYRRVRRRYPLRTGRCCFKQFVPWENRMKKY